MCQSRSVLHSFERLSRSWTNVWRRNAAVCKFQRVLISIHLLRRVVIVSCSIDHALPPFSIPGVMCGLMYAGVRGFFGWIQSAFRRSSSWPYALYSPLPIAAQGYHTFQFERDRNISESETALSVIPTLVHLFAPVPKCYYSLLFMLFLEPVVRTRYLRPWGAAFLSHITGPETKAFLLSSFWCLKWALFSMSFAGFFAALLAIWNLRFISCELLWYPDTCTVSLLVIVQVPEHRRRLGGSCWQSSTSSSSRWFSSRNSLL